MMFLTKEQVDTLNIEQCEKALNILTKTYKLDKPLQEYMTPQLWDDLDSITNTLLYLEDRIAYIKMVENVTKANQTRWSKETTDEDADFVTNYG